MEKSHQDFHPGNILSYNFKINMNSMQISDFRLTVKNIQKLLMYIIAYEMVTGFPPYPDIKIIKICNGLRPKIPFQN
ncbi:hypothetical protein Glove_168g133 [Diversispora epigaea]|uniref:Protein kinase domain-containing protein n=1 Tax=Diversispora epigaea TaxID=1348612 RepID=A0A397IW71_9GLOM|nr:hypothetical protein Glove_168g133 [Diversispora epigaea]